MKKKLNIVKIYFTLLIVIIFSREMMGTEYYVANSSQITGIQSSLVPGDTVTLANGIWYNQIVKLTANGTEQDTIVVRAETPGYVIFTGKSFFNIAGKFIKVDGLRFEGTKTTDDEIFGFRVGSAKAYNCRLTNTRILNYNPPTRGIGYKWVSIYGKNNRVDHCYFSGKNHDGALLVVWMPDSREEVFHRIDHNYFGEIPPLGQNGGETIRIGTSTYSLSDASCIVEHNYFERCNGEAEIISNKTGNNTFRYNTFFECEGTLTFRHGEKSYAYGNYFFGNNKPKTGGIRLVGPYHQVYNNYFQDLRGGDSDWNAALTMMNGIGPEPINGYTQVDSVIVAHNTFVNCKNTFLIGAVNSSYSSTQVLPPVNSTFANNIVSTNENIFNIVNLFENMTFVGNIMNGSSLGIEQPAGITIQDPSLFYSTDSLWRIDETSPAYNAAAGNFPVVQYDMDGQLRDLNKDIGADEVSTEPITVKPKKKNDVGPIWINDNVPLGVSVSLNGSGSVEFNPPGGAYDAGTVLQLTAIPQEGSTFDSWSGDITGTENPISFSVNTNMQITANFIDPIKYKYTLWKTGLGDVQVSPDLTEFPVGTKAVFTAIPADGWQFVKWNGSLNGTNNPDTLVFDSDETIQVVFELITSVKGDEVPLDFKLEQNYPNPFNASTQINYSLKEAGQVKIVLYNTLGTVVEKLVDEVKPSGYYQINYDASSLSSGVYFISFEANGYKDVKKMVLNK